MADPAPLVMIFITDDPLRTGVIREVYARIEGGIACGAGTTWAPEGCVWHRTRWAAENYARQLQARRIDDLRGELARLEGLRFGRPGR